MWIHEGVDCLKQTCESNPNIKDYSETSGDQRISNDKILTVQYAKTSKAGTINRIID